MKLKRTYLLIFLLPLLALWCWLCWHVPIFGWNQLGSLEDGRQFYLIHNRRQYRDCSVFDIVNRQHRIAKDSATDIQLGIRGLRQHLSVVQAEDGKPRIQLDVLDELKPNLVRSIELNIPPDGIYCVVANRYFVSQASQSIRLLDLAVPDEKWSELLTPQEGTTWLLAHSDLPVFSRFVREPSPVAMAINPPPPQSNTELYGFDDLGQLKLLAKWPTSYSGFEGFQNASFQKDTIASLDQSGKNVEFRSLDHGELVDTVELTPPVDLSKHRFVFDSDMLIIHKGIQYQYYSLKYRKWLAPPKDVRDTNWTGIAAELTSDSSLALWHDRAEMRTVVTDTLSDSLVCEIEEPGVRYAFLDDKTLISIDPWLRLTIRQHDLTTGKTVLTWRPFWWVAPLLGFAMVYSGLWIKVWLQLGRPYINFIWLNQHGLLFMLMVLISLRLGAFDNPVDTLRLPYQHSIYLTSGFLFVAWMWFVLGFGSILVRLSHLLIVYTIVFTGIAHNLYAQPRLAWLGVALVTLPCMLAIPAFLAARIIGFSWSTTIVDAPPVNITVPNEKVTLRQILFVTTVVAVLALMVRPIFDGIPNIPPSNWPVRETAVISFISLAAVYVATTNHVWLQRVGLVAMIFSVLALGTEAMLLASYDGWWLPQWWLSYEARQGLGQFCTVFVVTLSLMVNARVRQRQLVSL